MRGTSFTGIALAVCLATSRSPAADAFHWGNVAIGGGGFVSAVLPSYLEKDLFYVRTDVGGDADLPGLCGRCAPTVAVILKARGSAG